MYSLFTRHVGHEECNLYISALSLTFKARASSGHICMVSKKKKDFQVHIANINDIKKFKISTS